MNPKNKYSEYLEILSLFKKDKIDLFKIRIKKSKITQVEKSLLRIRIYFREQQWKKSISLLESFSGKYSDFLTAESFSLLSYAYFMKGDYQNAFINNAKSIELLLNMKSTEQLFLSNYNQSVYIARMRQINISNYYLEQASKFTSTLKDTLMVNRALATNYSNQLRYVDALQIVENDLLRLKDLEDIDTVIGYKVVAVDIYARNKQLYKSIEILTELRKNYKSPFKSRIAFEFQVASYLHSYGQTKISWPSFLKNDTNYSLKVKIIDLLIIGNIVEAEKAWIELARQFPGIYLNKFEVKYSSDKDTLFYKLVTILKCKEVTIKNIQLKGKLDKLYVILSQQVFPCSKEELIESIWGIPYDPSYDSRFYKLIQRLRSHVDVLNVHGAYSINSNR